MYYFLMNDFHLCSEIKRDDDTGFDIFNPETSAEVDSQFLTSLDVICACIFTKLRKSQEINILILLKKSYYRKVGYIIRMIFQPNFFQK